MIYKYWYKFWFKECSPLPVALFRICLGYFILQKSLLSFAPNFFAFFGIKPIVDTITLCTHWWRYNPVFDIFLLLPSDNLCRLVFFSLFLLFVIFMMIGFCTRSSTIAVYLALLSLDKQAPFILDGSDDFTRIMTFLLIFAPAGAMYSVDAWLKRPEERVRFAWPWAQRMMQVQLSLAYFHSFICKAIGEQWQNGSAVYYAAHLLEFQKFPIPWLTNNVLCCRALTYFTLSTELSLAILIWFKPIRYWILLVGVMMHIGIDWTMNLPYFEFAFVSCYLTFIEPPDLEKLINFGKNFLRCFCKGFDTSLFRKLLVYPPKKVATENSPANASARKQILQIIRSPYLEFPLIFIALAAIMILGAIGSNQLRYEYLSQQNKYNYPLQIFKEQVIAENNYKLNEHLPDDDDKKLATEETLAYALSTNDAYDQADQIFRHICKLRIAKKLPYDEVLVKTMSSLGDIYLEMGRLEAAELCYQTLLDYNLAHAPKSSYSAAIDLNNLGVISYFRSLVSPDKNAHYLELEKANNLFQQGLDKLHLRRSAERRFSETEEQSGKLTTDILSNQYLALRDACKLQEAELVRAKLP